MIVNNVMHSYDGHLTFLGGNDDEPKLIADEHKN